MSRFVVLTLVRGLILELDVRAETFQILIDGPDRPDTVVEDDHTHRFYWADADDFDPDASSIKRVDADGSNKVTLVDTERPDQLAGDWAARKLYWTDRARTRVLRCNLDGSGFETVVDRSRPAVRHPRDPAALRRARRRRLRARLGSRRHRMPNRSGEHG